MHSTATATAAVAQFTGTVRWLITMSMETEAQTGAQNLENIDLVGDVRRKKLRGEGYVNAGDVAMAEAGELYEQVSGLSKGDAEKIVNNARELIGEEADARIERGPEQPGHNFEMATIPSEATDDEEENKTPDKYTPDDEGETMSAEEFLETIPDPEPEPEECKKVLLIAGDGAFDHNGTHGDLSPNEQAQLVLQRISEFGFTNVEEIGMLKRGMGRTAVNSFIRYQQQQGNKVPDIRKPFEVADGLSGKEGYDDRDERAIEWADGICTIANGEFVGKWVNMTRDTSTTIRTPQREDDEEEDEESEE